MHDFFDLSEGEKRAIRDQSKHVFGNRYRLEVAVAATELTEPFYQAELARACSIADSQVRPVLSGLVAAGLIRDLGRQQAGLPKFFERRESAFWGLARQLLDDAVTDVQPSARTSTVAEDPTDQP